MNLEIVHGFLSRNHLYMYMCEGTISTRQRACIQCEQRMRFTENTPKCFLHGACIEILKCTLPYAPFIKTEEHVDHIIPCFAGAAMAPVQLSQHVVALHNRERPAIQEHMMRRALKLAVALGADR